MGLKYLKFFQYNPKPPEPNINVSSLKVKAKINLLFYVVTEFKEPLIWSFATQITKYYKLLKTRYFPYK